MEMQIADSKVLQDLHIVGDTAVHTLGCSLNGLGRKPTTLVPLAGDVTD